MSSDGTAIAHIDASNGGPHERRPPRGGEMLWTICVILAVMWLLGMVSSYTMGGAVHLLLLVAVVIVVINLLQGRRSLI
jgi:hypothetical protein